MSGGITKIFAILLLIPATIFAANESEETIKIEIHGEVVAPGEYSVPAGVCLIEVIAANGKGFSRLADMRTVKVFRIDGSKLEENCHAIIDKLERSGKLTLEELRKHSLSLSDSDKIFVAEPRD